MKILNKQTEIALETIILAMDEIRSNLQKSNNEHVVAINAEAMKHLAEAYALIYYGGTTK